MAFGYQFSGDTSMQGPPMMSPHPVSAPVPLGGEGMGKFGKKLGAAMRASSADSGAGGQGVSADPSGGALGAMSSAEAGEYQSPNTGAVPSAAPVGGSAAFGGTGAAYGMGSAAAGPVAQPGAIGTMSQAAGQGAMREAEARGYGTPLGYGAADVGAQAWQPRSAVGPRPFGY